MMRKRHLEYKKRFKPLKLLSVVVLMLSRMLKFYLVNKSKARGLDIKVKNNRVSIVKVQQKVRKIVKKLIMIYKLLKTKMAEIIKF